MCKPSYDLLFTAGLHCFANMRAAINHITQCGQSKQLRATWKTEFPSASRCFLPFCRFCTSFNFSDPFFSLLPFLLPSASSSFVQLRSASFSFVQFPSASFSFLQLPQLPSVSFTFLQLAAASLGFLQLASAFFSCIPSNNVFLLP